MCVLLFLWVVCFERIWCCFPSFFGVLYTMQKSYYCFPLNKTLDHGFSSLEVGPGHKPSMVHGSTTIASEEKLIDHAADGLIYFLDVYTLRNLRIHVRYVLRFRDEISYLQSYNLGMGSEVFFTTILETPQHILQTRRAPFFSPWISPITW